MTLDELDAALAARPPIGDLLTGGATEAEFRDLYAGALGLDEAQADVMMAQMWDAYCGELDRELFEWFTSLRGDYLLGILSNSSEVAVSGAREAGWHAVLHTDTPTSIGELERLLAEVLGKVRPPWEHRERDQRPAEAQHLSDLVRLRRVRDRIDREYAQPLDVEALARGAHMSAGHLSRQFRLAYGESPYSYLMTRRIERAMALLRRGDLSVTEVCFAVGCSSLGTFSTRFTELVGMPPSTYRRRAARTTAGLPPCVAKQVTRPVRNREARADRAARSVTGMDLTIHSTLPAARRPRGVPGVLPRHPRLRGPPRRRPGHDALDHGRSGRPVRHVDRAAPAGGGPRHHRRRAPHHRGDDGQGHLRASSPSPPATWTARSSGSRPVTPTSSRSRPSSRTACATAPSATPPAT